MNIEEEIFKRANVNYKLLIDYGFKKNKDEFIFEKNFFNDEFKAVITISNKGISGKVIDLQVNEEYLALKTKMSGKFVNNVRDAYKEILIDIKNNCFETNYFISNQANRINKYINKKYKNDPEFLWDKFSGTAIYRNKNTNKWYGIIMNIDLSKLDSRNGEVEIINVKLDPNKIKNLLKQNGFYEAYHMSKKNWISILLNDTVKDDDIFSLIDQSYNLVSKK